MLDRRKVYSLQVASQDMETPQVDKPKKARKRASIRERRAASITLQSIANGTPMSGKEIMLAAGYSPATAKNPEANLFSKKTFQELLGMIDDDILLARIVKAVKSDDHRSALQGVDMLMKLKDRYPANKLKLAGYQDEIADLTE